MEQRYIDAFWSKVDKTSDCWEWTAARDQDGYGRYGINGGKQWRSHRLVLELAGVSIPKDKVVLHSCDNPGCCNPAHLSVGTIQENNADKILKRRQRGAVGQSNGRSKLCDSEVLKIRQDPRHYTDIAQELNLHPETIRMAKTGKTWKHLKETQDAPQ